jgi:hypothetical protein
MQKHGLRVREANPRAKLDHASRGGLIASLRVHETDKGEPVSEGHIECRNTRVSHRGELARREICLLIHSQYVSSDFVGYRSTRACEARVFFCLSLLKESAFFVIAIFPPTVQSFFDLARHFDLNLFLHSVFLTVRDFWNESGLCLTGGCFS